MEKNKVIVKEHRNPVINADTLEIDFSAVSMYLKCPKQYEFRYVKGMKAIPGIALFEGSSHHAALEMNNLNKRDKGFDLKPSALTDKFAHEFRERVEKEEQVDWGEEKEDGVLSRAKILHERYIKDVAPEIKPIGIEEKFEKVFPIGGKHLKIYGTMDLKEKAKVSDYKTVARIKSQGEADASIQLSLYAWAAQVKEVGFICLVKKANPEVGIVNSRRDGRSIRWALQVALEVAESVQRGAFNPCDPTSWACNPKWCGYYPICRGKR